MDKKVLIVNFLLTFIAAFLAISLFAVLHRPPNMPMPQTLPQMGQPPMPPSPPMGNQQQQVGGPQMMVPPQGQSMPPNAEK